MRCRPLDVLFVSVALAACQSTTELVVRVDSDLIPGAAFQTPASAPVRFDLVRFKLEMLRFGDAIDTLEPEPVFRDYVQLATTAVPDGASIPVELGVVARGNWRGRELGIEVRGQETESNPADDDDQPYIYTRALVSFVEGQVSLLSLHLSAACSVDAHGIPCDPSERCVASAAGGKTTCEATPVESMPPRYGSSTVRSP